MFSLLAIQPPSTHPHQAFSILLGSYENIIKVKHLKPNSSMCTQLIVDVPQTLQLIRLA